MKHLYFLLLATFVIAAKAQTKKQIDSLAGFDGVHLNGHLSEIKDEKAKAEFTEKLKRDFIKNKYELYPSTTFTSAKTSTSTCSNLDFEDGNLGGWTVTGDFQLMTGSALDPFGTYPVVCPGGNYSLRLNDNNTTGKLNFVSNATHTLNINSSNSTIKVSYAGNTLMFPHPANATSLINIQFLDASNNVIPTQSITVYYANPPAALFMPSGASSFTPSTMGVNIGNQTYSVASLPWQSQTFNLSSYIGQTIKVKLVANWCLYNYDWSYAYFDVCCSATCPTPNYIGNGKFCTSYPYNLCAPAGQQNYQWSDSSGPIGTSSCITVNSAGTYSLTYNAPSSTVTVYNYYTFNTPPTAGFSIGNTFCSNSGTVALVGSPPGGSFSGPGIFGNIFDPSSANLGLNTITYTYKDTATLCSGVNTQTTNITFCTGINSLTQNNSIQVSPNPFKYEIVINGDITSHCEFILFNAEGKEVLHKKVSGKAGSIPVADLPSGIYFYTLSDENQVIKKGKLVRE